MKMEDTGYQGICREAKDATLQHMVKDCNLNGGLQPIISIGRVVINHHPSISICAYFGNGCRKVGRAGESCSSPSTS